MLVKLNEDCPVCDQSKMKVEPFPKNDPQLHVSNPPFREHMLMAMERESEVLWKAHPWEVNPMKMLLVVMCSRAHRRVLCDESFMRPLFGFRLFFTSFFVM